MGNEQADMEVSDAGMPVYVALDQPDACEPTEIGDTGNSAICPSRCEDQDSNRSTVPQPQPNRLKKAPVQPGNLARRSKP